MNPLQDSLEMTNNSNISAISKEQVQEDDQLRDVLDDIDLKIGQAIEDKERESRQMKNLQKQIKEAKETFTSAYKSYKSLKTEEKPQAITAQEIASARFNQIT
jgi:hypothetical protein